MYMYICIYVWINLFFLLMLDEFFEKKERNEDVFEKKKLWMDIIIFFVVWFELCNRFKIYIYVYLLW